MEASPFSSQLNAARNVLRACRKDDVIVAKITALLSKFPCFSRELEPCPPSSFATACADAAEAHRRQRPQSRHCPASTASVLRNVPGRSFGGDGAKSRRQKAWRENEVQGNVDLRAAAPSRMPSSGHDKDDKTPLRRRNFVFADRNNNGLAQNKTTQRDKSAGGRRHGRQRPSSTRNGSSFDRGTPANASPSAPAFPSPLPSSFSLVSVMNKLSRDNYERLLRTTKANLHAENDDKRWEDAVRHILDKCCTQTFYVDLYVRFLRELMDCPPGANLLPHDVNDCLNAFVRHFVNDVLPVAGCLIIVDTNDDSRDNKQRHAEDVYCEEVKRRSKIIGAGRTVLRIVAGFPDGAADADVTDYLRAINASLTCSASASLVDAGNGASVRRETQLDVTLELLLDVFAMLVDGATRKSSSPSSSLLLTWETSDSVSRGCEACVQAAVANYDAGANTKCRFRILDVREAFDNLHRRRRSRVQKA